MPTDTFLNLSEQKKEKIIKAAKKEFARVPISEASIQNIVKDAEIARGSFYQYFESKADLMHYIAVQQMKEVKDIVDKTLQKTRGDIFATYLKLYDVLIDKCEEKINDDGAFYKKVFENIKVTEESMLSFHKQWGREEKADFHEFYEKIDKEKLKYQEQEDIEILIKTLNIVTRNAVATTIKNKEKKVDGRRKYKRQLEFMEYGVSAPYKKGEKEC